jgi:hypothetical protein
MKEKKYFIAQPQQPGQLSGGGLAPTAQDYPIPLLSQKENKDTKKTKVKKPKKPTAYYK